MPLQHEKHETGHDRRLPSTVAHMVTTTRGTVDVSKFANRSVHLSVNAGGGSKQKMRWAEDGREGQFEALSKR